MSIQVDTYEEAKVLAAKLRGLYKGTDWRVTIAAPLFNGDKYRVNVG